MYLLCPSAYNVSKAKEDFPDPDTPVITVNLFLGMDTLMFFKLWTLAPLISMCSLFSLLKTNLTGG